MTEEKEEAFDDVGLSISRLSPELVRAAEFMPVTVAADLVRVYYGVQEYRLKIDNQIRETRVMECAHCHESLTATRKGKPVSERFYICKACGHAGDDVIDATTALYVREAIAVSEERAKKLLDRWSSSNTLSIWAREVVGIGPVLSAGLLAEIDVTKAPHASSVWRFAGLDPTSIWGKGEKRPYNADLKLLCWRIGDSFVKVSGREKSIYGHTYRVEKDRQVYINESGGNAERAAERLASGVRVPRPGTEARKALDVGLLPKQQIDLRARRKAVKLFLSHYWVAGRTIEGLPISQPYAIEKLGHSHLIEPEVPYPVG